LPTEALELLGKRTIEPRVSIQMVRCGGKILVLGVSPEGIRTLSEISDPVEVDLLAGACRRRESEGSAAASFGKLLQRTQPRAGRDVREEAS
jgi:flagellar biogenesis protein FliO